MMEIVLPNTQFQGPGNRLATRPASLNAVTVGFLDGWGSREADGRITMYPLMRELRQLLAARAGIADFVAQEEKHRPACAQGAAAGTGRTLRRGDQRRGGLRVLHLRVRA